MTTYAEGLIHRFRSKGALVDSNLLLLLLIGKYDLALLKEGRFKRVAKYTIEDFGLLVLLLRQFKESVTTPHILTEVSNLAGQLAEQDRSECFKKFVALFQSFTELNRSSLSSAKRAEFPYLGLTDCVMADCASEYLVITDDLRFCSRLEHAGIDALNFNHIRPLAWR